MEISDSVQIIWRTSGNVYPSKEYAEILAKRLYGPFTNCSFNIKKTTNGWIILKKFD